MEYPRKDSSPHAWTTSSGDVGRQKDNLLYSQRKERDMAPGLLILNSDEE